MKRVYCLILCCIWIVVRTNAQEQKSCAAHHHHEQKLNSDPSFKLSFDKLQNEINSYLSVNNKDQDGDIIIIPVVFQIIHNGDALGVQENISEDLILAQLQQLNDDFSRMNSDATDTPDAFVPLAANTQIQFCLAQVAPTGNATSGIIRTHINNLPNVNESDCWTPGYIDANIVTPLIWERDSYLNIFSVIGIDELNNGVCNFFSTLGYAQFPGGNANTDAAVVSFYTIGSLSMANPLFPNYLGRTCTHEVGHWLNLNHVWGGGNGGCGQDDGIIDTPIQFEESSGCPSFPLLDNCTTNGSGVMFMNYMDYSNDQCMNLFTAGQRGMMRASVFNVRTSLLSSPCDEESILSIPSILKLIVENTVDGNILRWELESDIPANSFTIKKASTLGEFYILQSINNCDWNNSIYNCSYLDKENEIVSYYLIMAQLENGNSISSEIEVVRSVVDISRVAINPNLVLDRIYFSNLNDNRLYQISIFNNLGQLLKSENIDNSIQKTIDINHFEEGIYYIKISMGAKSILRKIIKI